MTCHRHASMPPACVQVVGLPNLTLLATQHLDKDEAVGWLAGRLTEAGARTISVSGRCARRPLGWLRLTGIVGGSC